MDSKQLIRSNSLMWKWKNHRLHTPVHGTIHRKLVFEKPISRRDEPSAYINQKCRNKPLAAALKSWRGAGGLAED